MGSGEHWLHWRGVGFCSQTPELQLQATHHPLLAAVRTAHTWMPATETHLSLTHSAGIKTCATKPGLEMSKS